MEDYDDLNMLSMTNEEAYNAMALFFLEGYNIPSNVYNQALVTLDWSNHSDVYVSS